MILADQIEGIARAAIESIVAASREFSTTQHELARALAEHRRDAGSQTARLRAQLEDDADGAEAMPRLLLPADMTEASPHSPTGTA
ncbi:hypothetical protein [Gordonia aichiensis]|uniref:Uncharacterized protein n=1 Tax=Gordonia aichiensis NBRC 108223 TaxID=1220583 RepID=L7KLW5_9ACTN|nr:hypothetical protein [Gordonia aichiensis]GAC48708.1 hypothetical protein GOACH_06_02050 [Gordonia aichiensis NBRC 108223]